MITGSTDLSGWDTGILAEIKQEFADDASFAHIFTDDDMRKLLDGEDQAPPATYPLPGAMEYKIIVDCFGEEDQAALIADLESRGRIVKALIT